MAHRKQPTIPDVLLDQLLVRRDNQGERFSDFLDASVFYPVSLRNLLMRLTLNSVFQVS